MHMKKSAVAGTFSALALVAFFPFLPLTMSGCVASANRTDRDQVAPQIALLPLTNDSNDIEASMKVRVALLDAMRAKGYRLLELKEIDGPLKDANVTLGAQLQLFDDKRELFNKLVPADIHCYGTVVEFAFKNAVALTQRKVELKLKLVDTHTGAALCEGSEIGITTKAGLDAAADATLNTVGKVAKSVKESAKQLLPGDTAKQAADLTDVVADVDLTQETNEAIRKLLARFPKNLAPQSN